MKPEEAGRRYLQADMNASYTGLPDERREAYEAQRDDIGRKHPDAHNRALFGSDADFDEPLVAGEREHQKHLRRYERVTEHDVREGRKELRGETSGERKRGTARSAVRAGIGAGRGAARARRYARTAGGLPGASAAGSTLLYAIGVGIALTLVYLAVSQNGSKAFSTLLKGISSFTRMLVGPVDPLAPKATQAKQTPGYLRQNETPAPPAPPGPAYTPSQRRVGPAFGPAPGIGTTLQPAGGLQ